MPSPFPGMDPFIESQEWEDFHTTAITTIREMLMPRLHGHYTARVERRVYIEHLDDPDPEIVIPDLAFVRQTSQPNALPSTNAGEMASPVTCLIAMPQERRESYLVIKRRDDEQVVTVVELLSPSNKRRGSGREMYLSKREQLLASSTHLVELDLLRGGLRMPMLSSIPSGDYYAIVSQANNRPRTDVYAWRLQDPLPAISLPLARHDPDVPLDLQAVLDTVYDRAGYDEMLDYTAPLRPPADNQTQRWITQQLAAKSTPPEPSQ